MRTRHVTAIIASLTLFCIADCARRLPVFRRESDRLIGWSEEPPKEAPQAKPHQVKSTVVDSDTGKSVPSRRRETREIADIEARIARFTSIPVEHGEGLQILHYQPMEKYEAHYDYFVDSVNTRNGGQRLATMLMYLSDVEEGGETVFPSSLDKPHEGNASYSACAQRGVAFKPRKGDALLFYSLTPGGELDPQSLHGGCPVIRGSKWSATKWMRVQPYAAPEGGGGRAWRGRQG